jgi:hypothetical protein
MGGGNQVADKQRQSPKANNKSKRWFSLQRKDAPPKRVSSSPTQYPRPHILHHIRQFDPASATSLHPRLNFFVILVTALLPNRHRFYSDSRLGVFAGKHYVLPTPDTKASLDSLPDLDGGGVDSYTTKADAPFPSDGAVLEDLAIDNGEVDDGEQDGEASSDRPEEEAITPNGRKDGDTPGSFAVGIKMEKGPSKVLDFPRSDEEK